MGMGDLKFGVFAEARLEWLFMPGQTEAARVRARLTRGICSGGGHTDNRKPSAPFEPSLDIQKGQDM